MMLDNQPDNTPRRCLRCMDTKLTRIAGRRPEGSGRRVLARFCWQQSSFFFNRAADTILCRFSIDSIDYVDGRTLWNALDDKDNDEASCCCFFWRNEEVRRVAVACGASLSIDGFLLQKSKGLQHLLSRESHVSYFAPHHVCRLSRLPSSSTTTAG